MKPSKITNKSIVLSKLKKWWLELTLCPEEYRYGITKEEKKIIEESLR